MTLTILLIDTISLAKSGAYTQLPHLRVTNLLLQAYGLAYVVVELNPSLKGLGRFLSQVQGLPSTMPCSMVETTHSIDVSFL